MLYKFLPQQKNFFVFFRQAAEQLLNAAKEFHRLVLDLPNVHDYAKAINQFEHEGDEIAFLSYHLLHRTFITPFDRLDIHALTTQLDDILDRINRLAQRIQIYHLQHVPAEIIQLAELIVQVIEAVAQVVAKLEFLKNQDVIVKICLHIDQLENKAEEILLQGLDQLFARENDIKQLLKVKEVFEQMKLIINACQDVANLAKSIILEYA